MFVDRSMSIEQLKYMSLNEETRNDEKRNAPEEENEERKKRKEKKMNGY